MVSRMKKDHGNYLKRGFDMNELRKKMSMRDILSKVDHTFLSRTATWGDIEKVCDEGIKYQTATVCIPPYFVSKATDYVEKRLNVCTVIGFPNGYSTAQSKMFEAKDAYDNGANEIDMVVNLCQFKEGDYKGIIREINLVKESFAGGLLKVIIETCLLNESEKIELCKIVSESKADFIKTSTGFSKAGATFDDIKLFKKYVREDLKIKAAGGISSLEDAEKFVELGATRLGTSRIIKLLEEKSH